ncbi:MAG: tyrosine-type recombinase/integrase [Veillonellales bacterium]
MKGSLFKHHGTYYVIVDVEQENGKRKQKWVNTGTANKKEAEKALPKIVIAAQENELPEDDKITLSQFLDKWLLVYCKPNLRPPTYKNYESYIRNHIKPNLGRFAIAKLKPLQIQEFYATKQDAGLATATVNYLHTILNEALKHAVQWNLITKNPCNAVKAPKRVKYQAQVYSPAQLQILLSIVSGTRLALPVILAVTCGLRRGEVCGLRWQDIDLDNGIMHILHSLDWYESKLTIQPVKTDHSERSIKLPATTLAALNAHKALQTDFKTDPDKDYQNNDFVVSWPDGRPCDPDFLYRQFQKAIKEHNQNIADDPELSTAEKERLTLPVIRFHDLRHSHATLLLSQGVAAKIVSERLGHSRTSFTQDTYMHMLPGMQDEAATLVDQALQAKDGKIGHNSLWPTLMTYYSISETEAKRIEKELERKKKNKDKYRK